MLAGGPAGGLPAERWVEARIRGVEPDFVSESERSRRERAQLSGVRVGAWDLSSSFSRRVSPP